MNCEMETEKEFENELNKKWDFTIEKLLQDTRHGGMEVEAIRVNWSKEHRVKWAEEWNNTHESKVEPKYAPFHDGWLNILIGVGGIDVFRGFDFLSDAEKKYFKEEFPEWYAFFENWHPKGVVNLDESLKNEATSQTKLTSVNEQPIIQRIAETAKL